MKFSSSSIPFKFQDQQKSTPSASTHNPNNFSTSSPSPPTSSPSSAHADQQKALTQALEERRRLRAMENSAPDPINTTAQHRGRLVEHRIDQLRQELAEKNSGNQ
jgi:hypothetical protein